MDALEPSDPIEIPEAIFVVTRRKKLLRTAEGIICFSTEGEALDFVGFQPFRVEPMTKTELEAVARRNHETIVHVTVTD